MIKGVYIRTIGGGSGGAGKPLCRRNFKRLFDAFELRSGVELRTLAAAVRAGERVVFASTETQADVVNGIPLVCRISEIHIPDKDAFRTIAAIAAPRLRCPIENRHTGTY